MPNRDRPAAHAADLQLVTSAVAGSPSARQMLAERLACLPAIVRRRNLREPYPLDADALELAVRGAAYAAKANLNSYCGDRSLEAWAWDLAGRELNRSRTTNSEQARARERSMGSSPAGSSGSGPAAADSATALTPFELQSRLERLPKDAQEALRWVHFEARPLEELAELLDLPAAGMHTNYYRALELLNDLQGADSQAF